MDGSQFSADVSAGALADAAGRVAGVVEARQTIPILAHALLRFGPDGLALAATNMDQALAVTVQAEGQGAITVDAKRLAQAAGKLDAAAAAQLTQDGPIVTLAQGRTRYRLPSLPAADFPAVMTDPIAGGAEWEVPSAALARLLRAAAAIVYDDPARNYLAGANIDLSFEGGHLATTNGHCLCRFMLDELAPPIGPNVILPMQCFRTVLELAKRHDRLTLTFAPEAVTIAADDARFKTKLVDGTYPDVQRVVPDAPPMRYSLDAAAFAAAIDRAAIVTPDQDRRGADRGARGPLLALTFTDSEVEVAAKNRQGEAAETACPCERHAGTDITLGMQAGYLAWAVGSLEDAGRIVIALTDPGAPMVLVDEEHADADSFRTACPSVRVVMPHHLD